MLHHLKIGLFLLIRLRLSILNAYLQLVAKAYYQQKIKKNTPSFFTSQFLNYSVSFYSYPQILTLFEEIFIDKCYRFQTKNVSPYIIDGGSNIGMSLLYFKRVYPDAHIEAFEPDPISRQLLEKNIADNRLSQVTVHPFALDSENKKIAFHQSKDSGKLNNSFNEQNNTTAIEVNAIPLSSFVSSKVDLLKLDIEGAEKNVVEELKENNKLLLIKNLVIECHHQQEKSIIHLLQKNDFDVQRIPSLDIHPIFFFKNNKS